MMKRMRTLDVPKFRRPIKNRTRLGESVYFSSYNLIYLKFVFIWLGCIALDFVIGFRLELLWPVWLLVRHLYESFRIHAFSSSLHYSAFSVFFVCVTATSDLVCYLFIPIQVLLFIASTYVWMQFVYQSSDRGICFPSLILWALFIAFEYLMRYKFDNATWYLTRGSWITAGLFPSTADNVPIGSTPSSTSSLTLSPRLELYRPFAAHCIGFPVVTLGFRVKSFFSKWRLRLRKEEVMRQNKFFEKLLSEAVPTTFENKQHFISSSRCYLNLDADILDSEFGSAFSNSELFDSRVSALISPLSSYGCGSGVPLAICGNQSQPFVLNNGNSNSLVTKKLPQKNGVKTTVMSNNNKQLSLGGSNQGLSSSSVIHRRNGSTIPTGLKSQNLSVSITYLMGRKSFKQHTKIVTYSSSTFLQKLCRFFIITKLPQSVLSLIFSLINTLFERIFYPIGMILRKKFGRNFLDLFKERRNQRNNCNEKLSNHLSSENTTLINSMNCTLNNLQQDYDVISSSGDGSQPDFESDQEEQTQNFNYSNVNINNYTVSNNVNNLNGTPTTVSTNNKKKSKRLRGRTLAVSGETKDISNLVQSTGNNINLTNSESTNLIYGSSSIISYNGLSNANNSDLLSNGNLLNGKGAIVEKCSICNGNNETLLNNGNVRESVTKTSEFRQLLRDKEMLENSVEKLSTELKAMRSDVLELRTQLSQAQQHERISKGELVHCKTKLEQTELKYKQHLKQNEQLKSNIVIFEKRISELQSRKVELERELAGERVNTKHLNKDDYSNSLKFSNNYNEVNSQFKSKLTDVERELKSLKRELRLKDDIVIKSEEEIRQLRLNNVNKQSDEDSLLKKFGILRQKNYLLEQTLSSENRLKQDLFRALNDSKAQIETLKERLLNYERYSNRTFNNYDVMNRNGRFRDSIDELNQCDSPLHHVPYQNEYSQNQSLQYQSMISYGTAHKSRTPQPLSAASALNLEQLMQATGAQHMSYTFAPFSNNSKNNGSLDDSDGLDKTFDFSRKQNSMLTIGGHRTTKTCNNNSNVVNGHNCNNNILSSSIAHLFGNRINNDSANLSTSNSTTNSSTTPPTSFSNNNNAIIKKSGNNSIPTQQQQPTAKAN